MQAPKMALAESICLNQFLFTLFQELDPENPDFDMD